MPCPKKVEERAKEAAEDNVVVAILDKQNKAATNKKTQPPSQEETRPVATTSSLCAAERKKNNRAKVAAKDNVVTTVLDKPNKATTKKTQQPPPPQEETRSVATTSSSSAAESKKVPSALKSLAKDYNDASEKEFQSDDTLILAKSLYNLALKSVETLGKKTGGIILEADFISVLSHNIYTKCYSDIVRKVYKRLTQSNESLMEQLSVVEGKLQKRDQEGDKFVRITNAERTKLATSIAKALIAEYTLPN
jgi:hypothetical protein